MISNYSIMNKASIYLSQNNLLGEIILEKKSNNKIMVAHSNIANIIAKRPNNVIVFTSFKEIIEKIQSIIFNMSFTSRYLGMDMYDNKIYNTYDKDFKNVYIYGIQNVYDLHCCLKMGARENPH